MKAGWALFTESLKQMFGHPWQAIKLTGVVWVISTALIWYAASQSTGLDFFGQTETGASTLPDFLWTYIMFAVAIRGMAVSWIAVRWHRFLILGDGDWGWFPRVNPDKFSAYFLKLFGFAAVALLIAIPAIGMGLPTLGITAESAVLHTIASAIIAAISLYIVTRSALSLPAGAVDKQIGLIKSFRLTHKVAWAIWIPILLFALVALGIGTLAQSAQLASPISRFGISIFGWLLTMFGVSFLSMLYKRVVEPEEN